MIQINQPIVGYSVVESTPPPVNPIPQLCEQTARPEKLQGSTYKIKTPLSEHALYVTINHIVLEDGGIHPFEIFINSRAMDHFQWIVALTRVLSATFRKGGEIHFLVDELKSVCDPKGGYFNKGRYMPSLVAEIGQVIESHWISLGLIKKDTSLVDAAKAMLAEKSAEKGSEFPKEATLCHQCGTKALVLMDGCATCLNCGYSKCG